MLLNNFINLFVESAPWLVMGFLIAGLLKVWVNMAWMERQLGGHGLWTTVKAALLGAPLPLCSCGVIPAAIGLRRAGASKAATTSFLIATPETGVDSISVSYALLGPFMAVIRPIAAVSSAILAGLLVGREQVAEQQAKQHAQPHSASKCGATSATDSAVECGQSSECNRSAVKHSCTAQHSTAAQLSNNSHARTKSCCAGSSAQDDSANTVSANTMSANSAVKIAAMPTAVGMVAVAADAKPVLAISGMASGSGKGVKANKPVIDSCCAPKPVVSKVAASSSCCATVSAASCCATANSHALVGLDSSPHCSSQHSDLQHGFSQNSSSDSGSTDSCCASDQHVVATSVFAKFVAAGKYAAVDMVKDTAHWLLIGLFFAALVQTFVPQQFLAQWGDGLLAMLVMVLVSIPMYICATASTPIAAGLLLAGVSPGAVLVFMLAGPATNIATLAVVRHELGGRAVWSYLAGVLGGALAFGHLTNVLVAEFGFNVAVSVDPHQHQLLATPVANLSAALLALAMLYSFWRRWQAR